MFLFFVVKQTKNRYNFYEKVLNRGKNVKINQKNE